MSEFKKPTWKPFNFIEDNPRLFHPSIFEDFFLPVSPIITKSNTATRLTISDIETTYWHILALKYLKSFRPEQFRVFYQELQKLEITIDNESGFVSPQTFRQKSQNSKQYAHSDLDFLTTYYILNIYYHLGKLPEFLGSLNGKRKGYVENFILDIPRHLKANSSMPQSELLFYVTIMYILLGNTTYSIRKIIFGHMNGSLRSTKNYQHIFKLLLYRIFNLQDPLKENDLLLLHRFQKHNGGFNLKNSTIPNVNDSFWLGYTLETYSWYLPYRAGPLYSYILSSFKIEQNQFQNDPTHNNNNYILKDLSQLVVLYASIFKTLMDEVEHLVFTNISEKGLLNADVLSLKGGFAGAEPEIITLINQKYQFKLEILDNEMVFRRFLNRLNPFKEKLAIKIRNQIRRFIQFDINEFCKNYNRNKKRAGRIKPEIVIELLRDMEKEYFFTGYLKTKPQLVFFKSRIYIRENFIDKIIVCDRRVNWQNIVAEKQRLEEIIVDIYNMTNEIENSKIRIMTEIESMILVGLNPMKIEEQLKFLIKKTLIDATFFSKTIEAFSTEFVYIQPEFFLKSDIEKWTRLYNSLQADFHNVKMILTVKLDKLREDIEQKNLLLTLEKRINRIINKMTEDIVNFETSFNSAFNVEYSRETIKNLLQTNEILTQNLKSADYEIKNISLKITSKNPNLSQSRKKIIHRWVSHLEDFTNILDFYRQAFNYWEKTTKEFDKQNKTLVSKIEKISKDINGKIAAKDHNAAFILTKSEYGTILKEIRLYSKTIELSMSKKLKKSRKLHPLYQAMITEWTLIRNVLEGLIQKIKGSFQESITSDQESYKREKFQLLVESNITRLRQDLLKFKKQYSSLIKHDKSEIIRRPENVRNGRNVITTENYTEEASKLKSALKTFGVKMKQEAKIISKLNLNIFLTESISLFDSFADEFIQDVDNAITRYNYKKKIHDILQFARKSNKNYFTIPEVAKMLSMKTKETEEFLHYVISNNHLNAALIGDPKQVEIHNKDWRNYLKLKQETEIRLRELQANANMIQNYYNKSGLNHEIFNNFPQIETLCIEFDQLVEIISDQFEKYTQSNAMNLDNTLIHEEYLRFYYEIQKTKKRINQMVKIGESMKIFKAFLDENYNKFEDFGNSIINTIETEFQKSTKISQSTHAKWLKNHEISIKSKMMDLMTEVSHYKENSENGKLFDESYLLEIEDNYGKRVQAQILLLNNIFQQYQEQLITNETKNIRTTMEKFMQEKQEKMGQHQRKLDLEIKNKIRSREFLIAAKKLSSRSKLINKWFKEVEKEIKQANKSFSSKSKIYDIKHSSFLLEEWSDFREEFEETSIIAMNVVFTREIVLFFTLFSIKSLKEPFVPLKMISENLLLKHEQVQHILMGLISDGNLSGKIDIEHDVYYEGDAHFDEKTIARLEIIRKTNVKTYLRIQRFSNVFAVFGPILTGFASFLTILWYLIRLANNLVFVAIPIALVIGIFILLWIRKGKEGLS
ncbi:MAG: hypothetical protein ACTSRK_01770 [Promethearchaeota archaeon]